MEVLRNAEVLGLFNRTMDTWDIAAAEITVSRADADLYLFATAVPIYSGDSVSGTVITLHDITRLKLLEEMRKDFVANVSHEIKTPITAIKGFAETLLDGAIDDKENSIRFLGMIKNHSERLNSLVDDLLTISRIELGDIIVNKSEVKLNDIIDTVFAMLKEKADKKGLFLRKGLAAGPTVISADRDRLVQILLNLVENGIKFTEKGGVTVGFEMSGNVPALFVEDTGVGIPASHLPRLGERFYRVDRARSREMGGTGLGLAIVKHLVKAHDWEMTIESTPGNGTKVKLLIAR
jgi:two-component system, OmpR family, phosphate regulon sensor histidine kinase PhoR